MNKFKKAIAALAIMSAVTVAFVGCGGDDSSSSKESSSKESSSVADSVDESDSSADDAAADSDASGDACSDETFSALQDNYAALVEAYNAVAELYTSDEVEGDADVESALNQTADIMNEMGEITQDTITEADAESLNDSMLTLCEVLSAAVDSIASNNAE